MVENQDGCWIWSSTTDRNGYGVFTVGRDRIKAHRFSYINYVGKIDEGMVIDHLCKVKACCNPNHLEQVSQSENVRRGSLPEINRRRAALRTHCPQGHEYLPENVYVSPSGAKFCRACKNACSNTARNRRRANV